MTILGIILHGVNAGKVASWPIPKDLDDNGHATYWEWITMDRPPTENGQHTYGD